MAEHDKYDNIISDGYPRKRYHAYILHNEDSKNPWPGIWWGRVYGPTADGDFLTEWEAWEWLEQAFPDQSKAVQEVYWIAEPSKWQERSGDKMKTAYRDGGDM